ncbi:MAG TPA: class I SAM-dependent methyltransferase, partial [Solirubrobacteraceae bacterium]|nr:class I SAM-dependent methyltransferase [Solirubrobacteraceae bacterium]
MAPAISAEQIRDANARYHDVAAVHYDSKWGIDFGAMGQEQVTTKVRKALRGEPPRFERSLEIGSGTGYFTLNLMQAGLIGEATCSDISPGMLSTLTENASRLGLEVTTTPADAERLPFADGSFDLVLGHAVLHHIPHLELAFSEFARVLAPGGTLLFAGEPSRYGDRLARLPKRFAGAVAPLWRRALRARPAPPAEGGAPDAALESVVDVHAFAPAELRELAQSVGLRDVRVIGEELLANWFGWTNRTL